MYFTNNSLSSPLFAFAELGHNVKERSRRYKWTELNWTELNWTGSIVHYFNHGSIVLNWSEKN